MIINIILIILLLLAVASCMIAWIIWTMYHVEVPAGKVAFIERKGKHRVTLSEGTYIISPRDRLKHFCLDGETIETFLDMTKQALPPMEVEVVTADGEVMTVAVKAEYQVTNAITVVYKKYDAPLYATKIIRKALRSMIITKSSETVKTFIGSLMEAAASTASRMALWYGIRISVSDMKILSLEETFREEDTTEEFPENLFEDETEIPDIEEAQDSLPEPAQWLEGGAPLVKNPLKKEEDEIIDKSETEHLYLHYSEQTAGFNNRSHVWHFLNYLFRSDRKQKNTTDETRRNICAIRQLDGTFHIYSGEETDTVEKRTILQKEALELLENTDYYNIVNDEVMVNLYKGDIRYLRDESQLRSLDEEQEMFIFRQLVERYEKEFPPIVICAMHNDQDYGGKRVLNHIHRVIMTTVGAEDTDTTEETEEEDE